MTGTERTQKHVSKRTSKVLGVVILLVGAGLLAAGVAVAGQNELLPMALGRAAGQERSLSRGTVTLAIHVAAIASDGQPERAEGAVVTLLRPGTDGPVAADATDERGRVVFELRPGAYRGLVEYDGMTFAKEFLLRQDTRAVIVFDQDGDGHAYRYDRRDLARDGELRTLAVAVRQATEDGGQAPVADAEVVIRRIVRDADGEPETEPAARNTTGPRGFAIFRLEPGRYTLEIRTPDNLTASGRLALIDDQAIGVFFDANGTAHVRMTDGLRQGDDRSHLGVRVETEAGRPVAGAHVRVVALQEDGAERAVARGVTNDRGVLLVSVPDGAYRVEAQSGEYAGATRVLVDGDTRVRVVVTPS